MKLLIFLLSLNCWAIDCNDIAPFVPVGFQEVDVIAQRTYFDNGQSKIETICSGSFNIPVYDIRDREDESSCIKINDGEYLTCNTTYLGKNAFLIVLPSSKILKEGSLSLREYSFHFYLENIDTTWIDLFSRHFSLELQDKVTILEGAKLVSEDNPDSDGFFLRAIFYK